MTFYYQFSPFNILTYKIEKVVLILYFISWNTYSVVIHVSIWNNCYDIRISRIYILYLT